MVDFNSKFEEQIEKHINDNAYTDRKLSGAIIGTSTVGGLGFLAFNGAAVFGVSGSTSPSFTHLICYSRIRNDLGWVNRKQNQKKNRSQKVEH